MCRQPYVFSSLWLVVAEHVDADESADWGLFGLPGAHPRKSTETQETSGAMSYIFIKKT